MKKRVVAQARLAASNPQLVDAVVQLTNSLDHHIRTRNEHTHQQFLTLGVYVNDELYDPYDVLLEAHGQPVRRRLVHYLRAEMQALVRKHTRDINELVQLTQTVIDIAQPLIKVLSGDRGSATGQGSGPDWQGSCPGGR